MTNWEQSHEEALGKMRESPIIVSNLSKDEARKTNPDLELSAEMREFTEAIRERQEVVAIVYINFQGDYEQGQITVDKTIAPAVKDIFEELLEKRFPVQSVQPIASYAWDDDTSMEHNNTSAQNIRFVGRTGKLSLHSFGIAIDINPKQNPMVIGETTYPQGASYDPTGTTPGTVDEDIVALFARHGFEWGGNWSSLKDYQHFQMSPEVLRNRAVQALEKDFGNESSAQELAYWQKVVDLQAQGKVSQ